MSRDTLGAFETMVLMAVLHLGDNAYGAAIIQEIEQRTSRTASAGAVYVALKRLEKKGLVSSSQGASNPVRGGRPKRLARVTGDGIRALRLARREWEAMSEGLDAVLEEGS